MGKKDDIVCKHGFVTGLVQGVFFRLETRNQARRLGMTGWVRNMEDGRVEVMIRGGAGAVAKMEAWLRRGPARAEVTAVNLIAVEPRDFGDFLIVG